MVVVAEWPVAVGWGGWVNEVRQTHALRDRQGRQGRTPRAVSTSCKPMSLHVHPAAAPSHCPPLRGGKGVRLAQGLAVLELRLDKQA